MIKALSMTSALFAAALAFSALTAPAQAAAERCVRASQCKGPLPQICMYCESLKKSVCAHHVCVGHTCQIQICPEYKPYTPW